MLPAIDDTAAILPPSHLSGVKPKIFAADVVMVA
jgi:hypothetical protein